ncbi:MAG: hypothetical protein AAGI30_03210 [Planctomycetota bacterium]
MRRGDKGRDETRERAEAFGEDGAVARELEQILYDEVERLTTEPMEGVEHLLWGERSSQRSCMVIRVNSVSNGHVGAGEGEITRGTEAPGNGRLTGAGAAAEPADVATVRRESGGINVFDDSARSFG